ncbi:sugar/nucleoside kinase (ribokinase family) [Thermocatellispora tengchongensis]|uniref:Sugar/nucleoside kinase (Ribokinase family) n=1 Tax=Thermocatellispora tengchongensis TaxID=1073253 RepID=A0A840P3L0_9ACTN|nr:PfkB family carbohydrate kinase [Thermocatellispora tengchongensis]MBB5132060.1 sugar/nucleoside kinase (ribokinase family) [Thermocatellispora tengchongensis]
MSLDVLVVGGAGVDTTVYVPVLPLPYADTYAVPPIVDRIGNTGAGVVLGCHALGLAAKLVDIIGDDPQGRLVRETMEARGVPFAYEVSAAGTRRSVLLVDDEGRRLSLYDPRFTPGERLSAASYRDDLAAARHVHLSITDFSRHLYPEVREAGVPCSTDLHDWDGRADYQKDFAYGSDLVFLSAAALDDMGETMRAILRGGRAEAVICTAGARGAYLLTDPDGEPRHTPPAPLPGPVADSNGAGDAFVSGFLYGRLRGRDVEECMRLGAIAGAHACATTGTHEAPIDERTLLRRAGR